MGIPHVVAIPYPAQGHVKPLMRLMQKIVGHGFKVTFVNTDFIHTRVTKALPKNANNADHSENEISLVSIPDGLEAWEDRNDVAKLALAIKRSMPAKLEEVIEKLNENEENKVSIVIADGCMGLALGVAEKMGIARAAFWPASSTVLALLFSIPQLMEDGIIDAHGSVMKKQMIHLSPAKPPAISSEMLAWDCFFDTATTKVVFDLFCDGLESMKKLVWILCNTSYELEKATLDLFPKFVPIGPLSAGDGIRDEASNFWPEDSSCLKWLDQQPACSVMYVAFGSTTLFGGNQFQELALGLEQTNRPCLWVVRPDMADATNEACLKGFKERVGSRGLIVDWAPQQQVLRHPSVACFLSHCGWNSTTEGVSNGVPFLCWPYFGDQPMDQCFICDDWKIGLGFEKDENGIITKEEIKNKVEQLLGNHDFKARAMKLKEKVVNGVEGDGHSYKKFTNFIDWIKHK